MRNKLIFLAGVGIGYVLGARAGRERYEQILRLARKVRENPTVQETAGILQAQAGGLVTTAKDSVADRLGHTSWGARMGHFFGEHGQHEAHAPSGSNSLPPTPRTDQQ
jgi:hypothetical protein